MSEQGRFYTAYAAAKESQQRKRMKKADLLKAIQKDKDETADAHEQIRDFLKIGEKVWGTEMLLDIIEEFYSDEILERKGR